KLKKQVVAALKELYNAPDEPTAYQHLEAIQAAWDKKFPYIAQSWKENWENLATIFELPRCEVRKIHIRPISSKMSPGLFENTSKTKPRLPMIQRWKKRSILLCYRSQENGLCLKRTGPSCFLNLSAYVDNKDPGLKFNPLRC